MTTKKQAEVFSTVWTCQHHYIEITGSMMEIKLIKTERYF